MYLLHLFIYYLTYHIKKSIEVQIFWRLDEKVPAFEVAMDWFIGISFNFPQSTN